MGFWSAFGESMASGAGTSIMQGANNWMRYADSKYLGGLFGIEKSHENAAQNDYLYSALNALNYAQYFNPEIQRLNLKSYKDALKKNGYNPIMAITNGQVQGGDVQPYDSSAKQVKGDALAISTVKNLQEQNKNLQAQNNVLNTEAESNTANAEATRKNAETNRINAETSKWQIVDAKSIGAAGFEVLKFGASGKAEIIQSIRINKVTGEVYNALTGKKIEVKGTVENSAKPVSTNNQYNYYHYSNGDLPKEYKSKGNYRDWKWSQE